jgi:hypothetical protein
VANLEELYQLLYAGQIKSNALKRVLQTQKASLIQVLPQNEATGTTANDQSGLANPGTYQGTFTLANTPGPEGGKVVDTLGTGWNRIYSADFNTDFTGKHTTVAGWFKMNVAADWDDVNAKYFAAMKVDASNYFYIRKEPTVANQVGGWYNSGGTLLGRIQSGMNHTNWFHFAVTGSDFTNNSRANFYYNGALITPEQSPCGTFAGDLFTDTTLLGAGYTVGPSEPADCSMGPWAVWETELTAAEIANLAGV